MASGLNLWKLWCAVCAFAALLCVAPPASAGPPFITDDPEPTDTGHWENYTFISGVNALGVTTGQAGFDLNYGAYKDLQLTAVIPLDYEAGSGGRAGAGEIEFAAKYRFLHQSDGGWTPDVSFFPSMFAPSSDRHFGTGRLALFLPFWAEKDFGKWSVFGGGGYNLNSGSGQRDFWLSGIAIQRVVSEQLSLGAEVYHQTPDAIGARPFTGVDLGFTYKLIEHWSLLAAGGPGVENARSGRYEFYLALKADY